MRNMKDVASRGAIALAMALLVGGMGACRTSAPARNADERILIHPDGALSIDGRIVTVEQMPARLRSAGFEKSATLRIGIPETPSPAVLTKVSSVLASSGYQRIVFVKPRAARVSANAQPAPKQAAKPAKAVAPH
jgi:hypothetical protein